MQVVAVNIQPFYSLDDWIIFWKSKGAGNVLWGQDIQGRAIRNYRLFVLGTEVIIDRQGRVAFRSDGPADPKRLRAEIEKALAAPAPPPQGATGPTPTVALAVETFPDLGNQHFAQGLRISQSGYPPYNSDPPTSGAHWPVWSRAGFFPDTLPDELLVHNLEHGYIVIHYSCGVNQCPELFNQLRDLSKRYPSKVVFNYRPQMQSRIALTAWTKLLRLEQFDEQRIVQFIQTYRGRIGPEPDAP